MPHQSERADFRSSVGLDAGTAALASLPQKPVRQSTKALRRQQVDEPGRQHRGDHARSQLPDKCQQEAS